MRPDRCERISCLSSLVGNAEPSHRSLSSRCPHLAACPRPRRFRKRITARIFPPPPPRAAPCRGPLRSLRRSAVFWETPAGQHVISEPGTFWTWRALGCDHLQSARFPAGCFLFPPVWGRGFRVAATPAERAMRHLPARRTCAAFDRMV